MKHRPYFLSKNIQEKAKMTGMRLIEATSILLLLENIQDNANDDEVTIPFPRNRKPDSCNSKMA